MRAFILFLLLFSLSTFATEKKAEVKYLISSDVGALKLNDKMTKEDVVFSPVPVLTNEDFASAEAKPFAGSYGVLVTLKKDSAKKLLKVTTENKGKKLGLVVDGELWMAPEIKEAIVGDKMVIGNNLSKADAEKLASRLKDNPVKK